MTDRPITKSLIDEMAAPRLRTRTDLDLVLDVLRANRLHQEHCAWRKASVEPSQYSAAEQLYPDCDCWLAT
jgi:hypothetical protein